MVKTKILKLFRNNHFQVCVTLWESSYNFPLPSVTVAVLFSPSFHDKFLKLEVFSIHPNPHVYGQLSLTLTNTEAGEFVVKQNNNPLKTCLRAQSCPTLCNTIDWSLPRSSGRVIQGRILEQFAMPLYMPFILNHVGDRTFYYYIKIKFLKKHIWIYSPPLTLPKYFFIPLNKASFIIGFSAI